MRASARQRRSPRRRPRRRHAGSPIVRRAIASCQSAKSRQRAARPPRARPPGWRSPARRRRPARHMAARSIARPDSNEAVPSGGRPSNVPRSAMSAIAHRRRDVARRELLPGRQDGEPRALLERVVAEPPQPTPGSSRGGRTSDTGHAPADDGRGKVEVAGRERVVDGGVDRRRSPRYQAAACRWRVATARARGPRARPGGSRAAGCGSDTTRRTRPRGGSTVRAARRSRPIPVRPTTASQSGPESRSRIDVRVRKAISSSVRRSSSSDRR